MAEVRNFKFITLKWEVIDVNCICNVSVLYLYMYAVTRIAKLVTNTCEMDGPRIQKPKVVQYPSTTPVQKVTPLPTVDSDSGGIRIIPIQVDPGYRPRENARSADLVYGER